MSMGGGGGAGVTCGDSEGRVADGGDAGTMPSVTDGYDRYGYDRATPIRRITELRDAVVFDHGGGLMEAFRESDGGSLSIAFVPANGPGGRCVIAVDGLGQEAHAYDGPEVTKEVFEAIVSSPDIRAAAAERLAGANAWPLLKVGDVTTLSALRGMVAASSGVRPGSMPSPSDIDTGDFSHALGGPAARPDIVAMQTPADPDIARRVAEIGLAPTLDRVAFSDGLERSRHINPHGCFVDGKSPEELDGAKMFLSPSGLTGCAVLPDGDIVGVFNADPNHSGVAKVMLELAKQNGGTKMDCYGTGLVRIYERCGYEAVAQVPFNADYVDDTPFNALLLQERPPVFVLKVRENPEDRHETPLENLLRLPSFDDPEDGYGDALGYRDELLARQEAGR